MRPPSPPGVKPAGVEERLVPKPTGCQRELAGYAFDEPAPTRRLRASRAPVRPPRLLSLFDLAAAIDDEGNLLAVLGRLNGCAFSGGFDIPDLRIARGF